MSDDKLNGVTVTIWLPSDVPLGEREAFVDALAAMVIDYAPRTGWDAHMSAEYVNVPRAASSGGKQ